MNNQWIAARNVIARIEQAGFEAVFVGGAVRDQLLQKQANDIDVATSALPEEVKRIFKKTVDVGIEHGTILVLDEGEPIEVTTYRTDGEYLDHRRPESVQFVRHLAEDLKRRDFTMNAIAMKHTGEIIDLFDGQTHLQQRLICAVGNAEQRFSEDALRMLRAVRFHAQLGFTIEEKTFAAMQKLAPLLQHIAIERVCQELEKMWSSVDAYKGMKMLVESTLANYIPGDFAQHVEKWKAFHCEAAIDAWAFLYCITKDATLVKQFKLSNKEKNYTIAIANALSRLQQPTIATIDLFETETQHLVRAHEFARWLNIHVQSLAPLLTKKEQFIISSRQQLAVTGNDVMSWSNRKGGPWVKEALDELLVQVLEGHISNEKQPLKEWFLTHDND